MIVRGIKIKTILDSRIISRCPARILAKRRTTKVRGRIILLISSTKNKNQIRGVGVPSGTKWDKTYLRLFITPKENSPNQSLSPQKKLKETWEVKEKKKGRMERKLKNKIVSIKPNKKVSNVLNLKLLTLLKKKDMAYTKLFFE